MESKFYAAGPQRAAKVEDLFAAIASRYDLLNDVLSLGLHRQWKRRVVKLARARTGERALDVCCGTGDIGFGLAAQGAQVVGLDFSEPMLAVALKRLNVKGERQNKRADNTPRTEVNPQFLRGDAQQIPFPADSFNIVTVGYGLRNLADWELGLREMQRVAKPGGRLLVLEFGKPANAVWRGIYFAYLRSLVPLLGRIFCGNAEAYAYILESLGQYPGQHGVAAKMRAIGLAQVRLINQLGGVMSISYGEKRAD
jgi:demethylmenaquinone methyltransferase/2-methoxy-6-polyprenyl-1,4-benzoquinol methylase